MKLFHNKNTVSSTVTSVKSPPDNLPNGDGFKKLDQPIRDKNGVVRGWGEPRDNKYLGKVFYNADRAGSVIMDGLKGDDGHHFPRIGNFIHDMLDLYPEINSEKLEYLAIFIDSRWNDLLTFDEEGEE